MIGTQIWQRQNVRTRFSSLCTIRKVATGAKQRILQKKRKKSRSGNSGIFEGSNGCRLSENNAIQKLNEDFFQTIAGAPDGYVSLIQLALTDTTLQVVVPLVCAGITL